MWMRPLIIQELQVCFVLFGEWITAGLLPLTPGCNDQVATCKQFTPSLIRRQVLLAESQSALQNSCWYKHLNHPSLTNF